MDKEDVKENANREKLIERHRVAFSHNVEPFRKKSGSFLPCYEIFCFLEKFQHGSKEVSDNLLTR